MLRVRPWIDESMLRVRPWIGESMLRVRLWTGVGLRACLGLYHGLGLD